MEFKKWNFRCSFSKQNDEELFCFLFMWDLVYVSIQKNDTLPPFSCSIVPVYSVSSWQQTGSLLQKIVWFLSPLALKLCLVFTSFFFFNLNFQKSIYFCSCCQKTTLWRIFLGYIVEHSTAFTKNNARTGNPTCPLFLEASLCQWLCYLKID